MESLLKSFPLHEFQEALEISTDLPCFEHCVEPLGSRLLPELQIGCTDLAPLARLMAPIAKRSSSKARALAAAVTLVLAAPHIFQPGLCFRVYHYTNKAGYDGIVKSGAIRPSDIKQGDASYGPGVYGTKLPPSTPIFRVLTNNYDADGGVTGRGEDVMDRADYVIGFDVSDDDIVKVIDDSETRSVVVYGGGRAVSLREAVAYGRAADVAKLEEADKRLEEMLKEDDDLRYLLVGEDLPLEGSYELEFWYMDQLNYAKFMAGCIFFAWTDYTQFPQDTKSGP